MAVLSITNRSYISGSDGDFSGGYCNIKNNSSNKDKGYICFSIPNSTYSSLCQVTGISISATGYKTGESGTYAPGDMTISTQLQSRHIDDGDVFNYTTTALSWTISNTSNQALTEKYCSGGTSNYFSDLANHLGYFNQNDAQAVLKMTVSCGGSILRTKNNQCYFNPTLNFYYTPGCNITIYYLYSSIRPQANVIYTTLTSTNDQTVNLTTQMKWSGMPGYICNDYYRVEDETDLITSVSKPSGGHLNTDITLVCNWTRIYKVIFDKVLSDANFSYDQSQYINKYADDTIDTPSEPTINTYKFIGWALDDSITAETAILDNNNGNQNCWTTIPKIDDDQRNSGVDTDGYKIIYYAVWQERDSITISENVSNVATISVSNVAATSGSTYYFNPNITTSITINVTSDNYYLESVSSTSTTDLITNGTIDSNNKNWTSGTITSGTSGSAITINVNYVEGYRAFYKDENTTNPARAIKIYWENNRAIDLYYENTRLL